MKHDLKIGPIYYQAIIDGYKTFEIRKDDRGFAIGDEVILKEFIPESETYTGREYRFPILYMIKGPRMGLPVGLCVMAIPS